MRRAHLIGLALILALSGPWTPSAEGQPADQQNYLLLATNRTSTMQDEMQDAADQGYVFAGTMGGETSFGGQEVVVVMKRSETASRNARYDYHLLATTRTSTMQREMQEAGDAGYVYKGQTVFATTFGGDEAVVILERDNEQVEVRPYEYRLLATNRTSTMQEELNEAGLDGFEFVGVTVSSTLFGGDEVVAILKRAIPSN